MEDGPGRGTPPPPLTILPDPPQHQRRNALRAAALLVVLVLALVAAAFTTADSNRTISLNATVSSAAASKPLSAGFLGFSIEFQSIKAYLGNDPNAVNPVFLALVAVLNPNQSPVIRIGGDSSDRSWLALPGVIPPGGITYTITPSWLKAVHAMAATLRARLILGVNLAADSPEIAAAEARAMENAIGPEYISSLEVGNEPDIYSAAVWYRARNNRLYYARPHNWDVDGYLAQFKSWADALPDVPLAGPSFALPDWMSSLGRLLSDNKSLTTVTYHRYPLAGCSDTPTGMMPPSITNLLSDDASAGLASQIASYVTEAHAHGAQFRLDEINSESCKGQLGISDTFASSLWMLDTLFNLAGVNADGVNVHTLTAAPYAPFEFSHTGGTWTATVNPVYYGMLMFSQAFPPGAHLLSVSTPVSDVKVWATRDTAGTDRVVVINKDQSSAAVVHLHLNGITGGLRAETLTAPSLTSTTGVQLGGQSFASPTTTGTLGAPTLTDVTPLLGDYEVHVPAGSAVLLTS